MQLGNLQRTLAEELVIRGIKPNTPFMSLSFLSSEEQELVDYWIEYYVELNTRCFLIRK